MRGRFFCFYRVVPPSAPGPPKAEPRHLFRRTAVKKEPPQVVSKKENPGLYRLVTLLKESKPKEKGRFAKMARLYFEEEQKKR